VQVQGLWVGRGALHLGSAHPPHRHLQLLGVDGAGAICIEQVKGLADLLLLLLCQPLPLALVCRALGGGNCPVALRSFSMAGFSRQDWAAWRAGWS
jgi:hypothetical protein